MSALITHTFGNHREKEKEKKQIKGNFNKRSKAEKGKEQDHLKKTSLGPLRQGQRLDTSVGVLDRQPTKGSTRSR
jgi:hypothetical protein